MRLGLSGSLFEKLVFEVVGVAIAGKGGWFREMDPFVFDQRFARFVGQVDTLAATRGTILYESGAARVDQVGSDRIQGSVLEKREGAFRVSLAWDESGGMSGSCSCAEFFNCAHSYALARAARDQIVGMSSKAASGTRKVVKSDSEVELERLWDLAKRSSFVLYPKDLYHFVQDRKSLGVAGREPLRDLKRALLKENPQSAETFAAVVHEYFEYKGIAPAESFARPEGVGVSGSGGGRNFAAKAEDTGWDRPALRLKVRVHLEESPDRDWFQARASWAVEGGEFDAGEIEKLRAAGGMMVKIEGKGWYRLDETLSEKEASALSILGLDPDRGNSQRVHLCQIEDLLSEDLVAEQDWRTALLRAERFKGMGSPSIPAELAGVMRPYQLEGFAYLCQLSQLGFGGILADDMGLGKTLQTLAWMLWLAAEKRGKFRALVVCPKSVTDNWVQEPVKFGTSLDSVRFSSGLESLEGASIVVANYTQLRIQSDYFLSQDWDAVVLDEAQYIKSPDSQTSKVAYKLKAENRLVLTGTPIENSLTDLWSLMRFAMPRLLGPLPTFRANYDASGKAGTLENLRLRMRPFMLRRLKKDVAKDLPDRIEKDVFCDLEDAQRELYESELEQARALLKVARAGESGSFNVLQALLRLRQVCCDPRLLDTAGLGSEEPSAKVLALLDIVSPLVAEGHKVLVFSQFVRMLEVVEETLSGIGIRSLKLTGKTANRGELVERFQNGSEEQVFLLSLKAAGSGLTLTAASYVVLLDPWWNPAVEAQAIDRCHRIGQTDQVIAYRILAKDTVEEKIRKIQLEKAELAAALFGEGELSGKMGLDELEALLG